MEASLFISGVRVLDFFKKVSLILSTIVSFECDSTD